MKDCGGVLEGDALSWEGRASSWVLESSRAILQVQNTTLANLPAAIAVDVLDVVVVDVDDAECTVVVQVLQVGAGADCWVPPDKRCTLVVEELFERDQTVVGAAHVVVHLVCAAASVATSTPLHSSVVDHRADVPVVGGSRG